MTIPEAGAGPFVDIGSNVSVELRSLDGEPLGVAYVHFAPNGDRHEGWVPIGGAGWKLDQLESLTLSPSLLCRACGHHGFIRDGRWVPA